MGVRKFESLGQRDDAALVALGTAARIHDEIGLERTEARIVELAQRLKQGIADGGRELITPMDPALSHGVCITRVPGGNAVELVGRLYDEHGLAGAPTGGLRLCPTIYNTHAHVDRAVTAVHALVS